MHLLSDYAPYLNKAFVDERFAFVGGVLAGTTRNRPRWERGMRLLDENLGEALGKLYVEKHFPAESKRRMDAMVANLLAAYRQSITKLVQYHTNLLALGGAGAADAQHSAQAILALETEIARVQWSPVENRDPIKTYNLTTLDLSLIHI